MTDISSADIDRMVEGQTVARRFLATVTEHGERTALRWKDGDAWQEWTFAEYADNVARATTGMTELGVGAGDRVVLMMRNCPEFHVLDLAALMCGATPISIYNSSAPDQVEYLVSHCGATVGFVEDDGFLAKFEAVRDEPSEVAHARDRAGRGRDAVRLRHVVAAHVQRSRPISRRPQRSVRRTIWPRSSTRRGRPGRPRA